MVSGVPGTSGLPVPSHVELAFREDSDSATIPDLKMAGEIV